MYIRLISCCILVVLLYACATDVARKNTNSIYVDLDNIENEIPLDEYIDTSYYKIIPLTDNGAPIGEITKMKVVNDTIFIFDEQSNSINVYSETGQSILSLRSIGKASNEYIEIMDFDYSDGVIYIADNVKMSVMEYNMHGDFLKAVDVSPFWINKIFVLNTDIYLINDNSETESGNYHLFQLDSNGNLINSYNPFDIRERQSPTIYCNANDGDAVLYGQCLDNIVYKVTGTECNELFSLDFGKYNMPREYWNMDVRQLKQNNVAGVYAGGISKLFVSENHVFVYVEDKDINSVWIIYNKEKGKIEHVTKGFDINGFKFKSQLLSPVICGDYLYNPLSYETFVSLYEYIVKYQSDIIDSRYFKDLSDIYNCLHEDSPPVIIKYRFKQ